MGVFDFAGAANAPDAGGGDPSSPPPVGLPSVASAPLPAPPPIAPAPSVDPRLQAALSGLQPKPQPQGWQLALQKIVPIIGAAYAMHNNAGGSFTSGFQQAQDDQQKRQDQEAERTLRIASILHQQEQERQTALRTAASERTAQMRLNAQAKKEAHDKQVEAERKAWDTVSQGDVVTHANEIAQTKGKDAADQYLSSFQGLNGTLKDLADRYGVRKSDTGEIALGKTKTPKEVTAGTQEDYVLRSRDLLARQLGRPSADTLTDSEIQKSDEAALKRYKALGKDEDATSVLKGLQADTARLRNELLQGQLDRQNQDKYGAAPTYFQDADGKVHAYIVKKQPNGPPSVVELPSEVPPDATRIQAPNAFMKWIKGVWGDKPQPIPQVGGGPALITDPSWGK